MDHHQFDEEILDKGTNAILKTRDGKLRAAVPSPIGKCIFLNDVSMDEMYSALKQHKKLMQNYPRKGEGLEAFVDASDTGYTINNNPVETNSISDGLKKLSVLNDDTHKNGHQPNGHSNVDGHQTNGVSKATKHVSGPEGVDGMGNGVKNNTTNGLTDGISNGETNGVVNEMNGHTNGVKVQA